MVFQGAKGGNFVRCEGVGVAFGRRRALGFLGALADAAPGAVLHPFGSARS